MGGVRVDVEGATWASQSDGARDQTSLARAAHEGRLTGGGKLRAGHLARD